LGDPPEPAVAVILKPGETRPAGQQDIKIAVAVHVARRAAFDHGTRAVSDKVTFGLFAEGAIALIEIEEIPAPGSILRGQRSVAKVRTAGKRVTK
jgi:hypothetical protein